MFTGNKILWSIRNSPIGGAVGGVATFYLLKKKSSLPTWAIVGVSVVGALVGSAIESTIKQKMNDQKTKSIVTGK